MKPIPTWQECEAALPRGNTYSEQVLMQDEIDALRTRLAELERDAARYQHIRNNEDWMVIKGLRQSPYFMGAPLDRNIDASMASAPKGE